MADGSDRAEGVNLTTVVPWLLTLLTAGFGIWQFTTEQAQSNRVPFLTEQLKLAFEASDTAARLATETDAAKWEAARQNFWRLYWGPLGIVEDRGVEAAMVALGRVVPPAPGTPGLPMRSLEQPSLQLAHAARDLILDSWRVNLPALQGRQP